MSAVPKPGDADGPDELMSQPEPKCADCGRRVSYETGFTLTGGLGDSSQDRVYCPSCAPNQGKGCTLSDLQRMRGAGQAERAKYEMSLMDMVGADVYFAVKGGSKPNPLARLLEMNRRMYEKLSQCS